MRFGEIFYERNELPIVTSHLFGDYKLIFYCGENIESVESIRKLVPIYSSQNRAVSAQTMNL